ncbi:S8 family serine peptidase [Zhihengliuella sp.]|uniref:S8 family serine peptidase n=1 Tax=Zhihengliuella sp. TaxID=1954483 RepID=UPI002811882F|nr:S8 family serine peptidase [Zhihengliuella sp.]
METAARPQATPARTGPAVVRARPSAARGRSAAAVVAVLVVAAGALLAGPAAVADQPREDQYWLEDYGITEAWTVSRGEGVKVAVIDTGIDSSHPDLTGNVVDGMDASGSGAPDGSEPIGALPEHGTLVATMLAGHGNNKTAIAKAKAEAEKQKTAYEQARKTAEEDGATPPPEPDPIEIPEPAPGPDGIIGVAPEADLLTASLWLGSENPSGVTVEQQIPRAVRWAVDQGAQVINLSLGSTSTSWPQSWDDAFRYAEEQDVVVVAAAGNRSGGMMQVGAPATIPGVLTVAGVNRAGEASWDASTRGITIGVAAPADPLVGGLPGGGYASWSGSSGAAPLVSGVAALIRSAHPELSAADVVNRILETADDAGASGFDNLYGYGILDADEALTADIPSVEQNPLGSISEWIRVHRRADADPSPDTAGAVEGPEPTSEPVAAVGPVLPEPPGTVIAPVVVVGFGVLALGVMVAGGVHYARARRAVRGAQNADRALIEGRWTVGRDGHDPFDELPERG